MKPMVRTPRKIIMAQKPKAPASLNATAQGKRKATSRSNMMKRIEAHIELHAGVVERRKAALVSCELFRVWLTRGNEERRYEKRQPYDQRDCEKDHKWQVG
jgi:predicted transcriptional regulator